MQVGARDHRPATFHGLTQAFQNLPVKFGQLVEKQDAEMSERDFSRFCPAPAADHGRHRGGMMWIAKGTAA